MNIIIYVLQLEEDKYYIGKTHSFEEFDGCEFCFREHQSGRGCEWTKQYKPISIIEKYEHNCKLEDNILTKKYMMKYGIKNVRGGTFTQIELDENIVKSLEREFKKEQFLKYLSTFETERQIDKEISRLENVVKKVNQLHKNIFYYKYVQIINDKNEPMMIEIEPSIIDNCQMMNLVQGEENFVNNSNSKNSQLLYFALLKYKENGNKPNIIRDENIVQNIYKVYIYRR